MRTSKLSATEITKKYGISRNKIQSLFLNHFCLPETAMPAIDTYLCLGYTGKDFSSQIYDGCITLHHVEYAVIYQGCKPADVKKAPFINVSFRSAHAELNLQPIAIVRIPS